MNSFMGGLNMNCSVNSSLEFAESTSKHLAAIGPNSISAVSTSKLGWAIASRAWSWPYTEYTSWPDTAYTACLYTAYVLLLWQAASILWKYWWKAPSNVIIAAYPTPLGRWFTALRMITHSESLLQEAYDSANGKPFAIPMTDRWIVFVTDRTQLKQLEHEPEVLLSMETALHELAFTESILGHFQAAPDQKGHKSEAFRVMVGVLKNKLRNNLPELSPTFLKHIKLAVAEEVDNPTNKKCVREDGEWEKVEIAPAALRIFTRVNLVAFLGEEMANRLGTFDDVMGFFWSCVMAFPVVNIVPEFLLPLAAPVAMGFGFTRKKVFSLIFSMTEDSTAGKTENQGHIIHWMVQMTRLRDTFQIAKITFGLLYASAFQIPTIAQFCLHTLCAHPEYQEKLIAEAKEYQNKPFSMKNEEMPYLDSFIKETARISPGPILSSPRTVMADYSLDGMRIPAGNWLAVPQLAQMRDEKIWSNANGFDGFRFVDKTGSASETRFTHPSHEYPFWGAIQHACPARFYVSLVMKLLMSHLLLEYEFKLENPETRPQFALGKIRFPNPFMILLMRRRSAEGVEKTL